jgi:hypothetical protein
MGEARKKPELDPEEARALSAREALSLIWSPLPGADEEPSGRGEEATNGSVDGTGADPASAGT